MALEISKKTDYGEQVQAVYWTIIHSAFNWYDKQATVHLAGFHSEEAYKARAKCLTVVKFDFHADHVTFPYGTSNVTVQLLFPFTRSGNNIQAAYKAITSLELWQAAKEI